MQSELPPELRDFIARYLGSVEHLEVLLLLHRSPERVWSAFAISQEFRSNEAAINHWLSNLVSAQLVSATGQGFRYQASTQELQRQTDLLAAVFRERPFQVMESIYAGPRPH